MSQGERENEREQKYRNKNNAIRGDIKKERMVYRHRE